jgi:hypothetical protein
VLVPATAVPLTWRAFWSIDTSSQRRSGTCPRASIPRRVEQAAARSRAVHGRVDQDAGTAGARYLVEFWFAPVSSAIGGGLSRWRCRAFAGGGSRRSQLGVDLVDHSHDSGLHLALNLLQADGLSKLEKFRSAPPCDSDGQAGFHRGCSAAARPAR